MRWANFCAHRTRPRANFETNNTSAATDAGQHETAITSATEKRTQNAHFSPAKAMAVSIGARPARAKAMVVSSEARPARAKVMAVSTPRTDEREKATGVSRERFPMYAGYGGAWPGTESTHRATHQRPGATVWRAPEGPEGTGGLRDRPLRAAGSRVAISRAAGPDGARNTHGATSNTSRKAAAHGHTKQPGSNTRKPRPADAGRGQPTQSGEKV